MRTTSGKILKTQLSSFSITDSRNYLLLFVLWPFLAFVTALINYSQKESKKVVYFFLIYFGLTIVISTDFYSDALGYAIRLKANADLPFSDFFEIVGGLYSDTNVDIVEPLVSFIVSRFTEQYNFYFAIWASIFGFFYLKSIDLLYERYQYKKGWNAIILLIFFIVILPINRISTVRMWTAAWMFFYGAYHIILFRDYKYFLVTLGASLIHWSFISANVILLIYFFVGNRNIIYLFLVLVSFVLPHVIAPFFQSVSLRLGGALQNRYESYSNEGYIAEIQGSYEHASWFLTLGTEMTFYYILLAIAIIQIFYGKLMQDRTEKNLFSFLLLFLSFVNFGKPIASFGKRFQLVFFLFGTFYIFLYSLKRPGDRINILIWIGLIPMLFYAGVEFRIFADSFNAWILTPGFGLPLLVPGLSIADLLFS